jgi:hypothetical protein
MSDLGQIVGVFFNFYFHKFTQSVHIYVVLLTFISSLDIIPREKQFENARRRTERKDFVYSIVYVNNHTDNKSRQGGGLFDRYFAQVEDIVQKMQELKSKWSSDLSAKEMEEMVNQMDQLIKNHTEQCSVTEMDARQDGLSPAVVKQRTKKIKQSRKLVKTKYQKFLRTMRRKMNSKLISMGDRRGFEGQEKENEDRILDAVTDVKKADETAQSAYGDLLKQKETIMGFNNHLGNVNTSIALAERYLRMMRDRDKRHRCYVFLMILGMFIVIGIGGFAIFVS